MLPVFQESSFYCVKIDWPCQSKKFLLNTMFFDKDDFVEDIVHERILVRHVPRTYQIKANKIYKFLDEEKAIRFARVASPAKIADE